MEKCNECIRCTVDNCRHHHNTKNYCTLETIQVGTHEANPLWISAQTVCLTQKDKIV